MVLQFPDDDAIAFRLNRRRTLDRVNHITGLEWIRSCVPFVDRYAGADGHLIDIVTSHDNASSQIRYVNNGLAVDSDTFFE